MAPDAYFERMGTQRQPRPFRHALALVVGLMVLAIPFGYSVVAEYRAYAAYVKETVLERSAPPPWADTVFSPGECVNEGLDWIEGCPGMEDFCRGMLPRVVRECLESQDRSAWCEDNGGDVKRTSFGYQICEARREAKGDLERTRIRKQRCALALRALAGHCDALAGTARNTSGPTQPSLAAR